MNNAQLYLKRVGPTHVSTRAIFEQGECYPVTQDWGDEWVINPGAGFCHQALRKAVSSSDWQPVYLINGIEVPQL